MRLTRPFLFITIAYLFLYIESILNKQDIFRPGLCRETLCLYWFGGACRPLKAAALDDGSATLTLELLQSHALSLAQCERMAIDTVEGEQKLEYMESRREHLWQLLKMGQTDSIQIPVTVVETPPQSTPSIVDTTEPPAKSTQKRNYSKKI